MKAFKSQWEFMKSMKMGYYKDRTWWTATARRSPSKLIAAGGGGFPSPAFL